MVWAEKATDEFARAGRLMCREKGSLISPTQDMEIEQDKSLSFHQHTLKDTVLPGARSPPTMVRAALETPAGTAWASWHQNAHFHHRRSI